MHEARASEVARLLLAFYREPLRHRSRLTHGREPFPGGAIAFRLAQGRFPNNLLKDLPAEERAKVREAAEFFIRQVCLWEDATHYQVLCVPPGARRDAVKEHYHGLIALLHPDRPEAHEAHWPADAAQRVNQAYAVLSDPETRAAYDQQLGKSAPGPASLEDIPQEPPHTAQVTAPIRGRAAAARMRLRRPALVVGAAVASLFFLHTWWAARLPSEYSLLSSAAPLEVSARWMRDVLATAERPRFLADGTPAPRKAASEALPDFMPMLALAPRPVPVSAEPRDLSPAPVVRAAPAIVAPVAMTAAPLPRSAAAPPPAEPMPRAAPQRSAQRPPPAIAQAAAAKASPPAAPIEPAITDLDMETLVALVVTYYEAGDLERLLALYDPGSLGIFRAARVRHDFEKFFRETRSRRLRLTSVSWDTQGPRARASGEAALAVQYAGDPRRVEREVKLEIDVALRDGVPRVTRLALFPLEG